MRQQSTSNSFTTLTSRFGAMIALSLSFALTACGGSGERPVIEGEPGLDGVAPSLNTATVLNKCNMTPVVALDDIITIELDSSESILKPVVTIGGNQVAMSGQHHVWSGEFVMDDAGDLANGDVIPLNISYSDNSGMSGSEITEADDGALTFCDSDVTTCQCFPEDISGVWQNANKINAMGVGPFEGDTSYWNVDDFELGRRGCVFDDTYTFVADENEQSGGGIFSQEMDNWTWLEAWASPDNLESCGDPTLLENYPWDGQETGLTYKWDPEQGQLTVIGQGAHIGIPRIINNGDAGSDGPANTIVYNIATASNCFISMNILAGADNWWHFELERIAMADGTAVTSESEYCSAAAAPVGDDTGSGDTGSGDTGSGDTGSGDTGSGDTGSGDTGSGDTGSGDTGSGDTGSGDTGSADNDNNLLSGNWQLAPSAGSLGVGPSQGNIGWWSLKDDDNPGSLTERSCLYDDLYTFSDTDNTYTNVMGSDTWIETWQGADAEGCGAPAAPHDGSNAATYSYDATAGTLTVYGVGAHIGLPKATNQGELSSTSPPAVPSSVTYQVSSISDTAMTLDVDFDGGWWRFELVCADTCVGGTADSGSDDSGSDDSGSGDTPPADNDNEMLIGNWQLSPTAGSLGVGGNQGNIGWWSADAAEVETRTCLYDDLYSFNSDGSFVNDMGADTWLEDWQGAAGCGAPVSPYDGSNAATYSYDASASTLTLYGLGAHIALPKVTNDGEISSLADAASSVVYEVTAISDTAMTLDIDFGGGWWRFELVCADDSCVGSAGDSGSDDSGSDDSGSDDSGSGDSGSGDSGSNNPNAAEFTGTFDGTIVDGSTFTFPAGAQDWAGFANENAELYPLSFPTASTINFTASSDQPVTLKFRFEANPYPAVEPSFETAQVVVDGTCKAYSVDIAAQPAANTYNSYLMYIIENDIPVTVNDIVIGGDVPSCDVAAEPEPEPNDPTITPLNITKTSNAAGMEFIGLSCVLSVDSDDTCTVPGDIAATQVAYISSSTISADKSQKVVTVSYTSDDSSTTGLGIRIHFDSSEMTLSSSSDPLTTDRISPDISTDTIFTDDDDFDGNAETDKFVIGSWASLFGQWPGSFDETGKLNLFTLTFDML